MAVKKASEEVEVVVDGKSHQRLVEVPRVADAPVAPMPADLGVVFSWQEAKEASA